MTYRQQSMRCMVPLRDEASKTSGRIIKEALFIISLSLTCGLLTNHFRSDGLTLWAIGNDAHSEDQTIEVVSPKDAEQIVQTGTVSVIDLRPGSQYIKSHPPGARNMPAETVYSMMEQIQKEIPGESGILLYGKGLEEKRVTDIARVLQMMGYGEIYILDEDWNYGTEE
jgi:rhodanese-related sulfurtransferase